MARFLAFKYLSQRNEDKGRLRGGLGGRPRGRVVTGPGLPRLSHHAGRRAVPAARSPDPTPTPSEVGPVMTPILWVSKLILSRKLAQDLRSLRGSGGGGGGGARGEVGRELNPRHLLQGTTPTLWLRLCLKFNRGIATPSNTSESKRVRHDLGWVLNLTVKMFYQKFAEGRVINKR